MATIVRGVLVWQAVANSQSPMASGSRQELLDAAGRRVMELQAGANDVRHLAPGVYFVHQASGVRRRAHVEGRGRPVGLRAGDTIIGSDE